MKKIYLLSLIIIPILTYAQYNTSAPWMSELSEIDKQQLSIDQQVSLFDAYWLTHDKDKKGSGYKPFMRWENHWRNKSNALGYLISPQEMWDAFNEKNNSSFLNKNSTLPPSNWEPIGPFTHTNTGSWSSGQGRVNYACVDPNNPAIMYIGTPAGGIWKSIDSGVNWSPLSDNLPQIGVSGIVVDHTNSNVIYIATGDNDSLDTYSIGVLKSSDGGLTWNTTGLTFTNTSTRAGNIIMDPTNNQVLYCATSVGLFKTTNAGANWTNVQSGNFSQGSVRFQPGNSTVVHAVTKNRYYRSVNSGASFTNPTFNLPPTTSSRLVLDVTPANSNYVYILCANSSNGFGGIYRSIDGGNSWATISTAATPNIFESTQSWYDLALAVSDTNPNELYTGCLNIWKSSNGGANFTKMNSWSAPTSSSYTHADIHFLRFYNGKLFCGSDGGIYTSVNGGTVFTDLTATAQISQFYKISVAKQTSANMVGGLQDNGGHAYSNGMWKNYYGADGMDTAVDPTNPNLFYGFIQNGGSMYISNTAGNANNGSVGSPGGVSGNWVTPLRANNSGELFSGFNSLYKLSCEGEWQQQTTSNLGSGNLELVQVDPSNDNIMYVVNGSGLYKSIDRGVIFNSIYSAPNNITGIDININNNNIVYITTSSTSGQVLKSINGGTSFTDISAGLPNIGKNCIIHQARNSNNPLYVGTSLGVYYLDDTMSSWLPFDINLPNVSVTDLEINLEDKKLIAATYGRGIWQTDISVETAPNDISVISFDAFRGYSSCGAVAPFFDIKNKGTNAITTINFNYLINSTPYSYTWNGTLASNATTTVTLPSLSLPSGNYKMELTANLAGETFLDNNKGFADFYVNSSGTIGEVNTFSSPSDALTTISSASVCGTGWLRGTRSSGALQTGSNTVYTTNLSGNYENNKKFYLYSRCYNLIGFTNPQLSLDMQYDLETNWDIAYVEYSTDLGITWNLLGNMDANWYNSNRTPLTSGSDCYNCVGGQWTGTNTSFNTYTTSLASLATEANILFRVVFHSDGAVAQEGVNVDNFVVTGTLSTQSFDLENIAIYPNPSTGIFTISLGNTIPDQIDVYDVSGKLIVTKRNFDLVNFETKIDLTSLAQGIYFVKIVNIDSQIVKRIIKK